MTEEITIRQAAAEATSAVPPGQQAATIGARGGADTVSCIGITLAKVMALTRQKAPIVGIPRPGDKPLALSRAILAGLLTDLTACEITLTNDLEIHPEGRHYRLRSLDMQRGSGHYKSLKAWAAREQMKKAFRHLSREERRRAELLRKIAVAERKVKSMVIHYRPYNPALECGEAASDYEREHWMAWYAQKPIRRRVGDIAVAHSLSHGDVEAGIHDPSKLYRALAVLAGQEVRKYGELRTTRHGEKPSEAEYLKHLYKYAGNSLESKPYRSQNWRTPDHIRQERLRYCQQVRDWRNAQETVNWLRAQLESFETAQASSIAASVID